MLFTAPAVAQDSPAQQPQAERGRQHSNPIVVTARRREESLQDTPVAVTALSADALERQQIVGTTDLDKVAPNLQFHSYGTLTGNNSAAQVFIRGIGQTDATPAVDPGVGIYIDDVYMGRAVGGAMEFRDIANVQILRGPQGTLFGRNTIGGAVLLTTNEPGDGRRQLRARRRSAKTICAKPSALSTCRSATPGPRASRSAVRQRDGYVERAFDGEDLGDEDMYTGQVALRWKPSDAFSLTLRGDYTKEDENGSPFVFQSMNEGATFVGAASIAAGCPNILDPFPPPLLVGPARRIRAAATTRRPSANSRTAAPIPPAARSRTSGVSLVARLGRQRHAGRSSRSPRIAAWNGPARATRTTRRC